MAAIEKQKLRQSREIEKLKGQIMHHNVDMKILSEKILDARVSSNTYFKTLKSFLFI